MTDVVVDSVVEVSEKKRVRRPSPEAETIKNALNDLNNIVAGIQDHIEDLQYLQDADTFKYVSKSTRNSKLNELVDLGDRAREAIRGCYELLRRVKREPLPDQIADLALFGKLDDTIFPSQPKPQDWDALVQVAEVELD